MAQTDTIFAVATGAGKAAIAIIRLSGPLAAPTLTALTRLSMRPRQAAPVTFVDPMTGDILDRGVALFFAAPASATGEDYAELHIHGGYAVIENTLAVLSRQPGLRAAQPGEFTRRAFENGKLDLSQVEALADLIDAQTELQRRQALRVAGGHLRRAVEAWRETIVSFLADIEAQLDFSDEGDVAAQLNPAREKYSELEAAIHRELDKAPASERMNKGFNVVLAGRPNVGKSTLLNVLLRREAAIVSPVPGTTRDLIEAHIDLCGLPITLIDTAGLRDSADHIEKLGVERARARAAEADLVIWLSDQGESPDADFETMPILRVATKCDEAPGMSGWIGVSAHTGEGLAALTGAIAEQARARLGDGGSSLLIRERHRIALQSVAASFERIDVHTPLECVAEELRSILARLGDITGETDVEDVLDTVFAQFCIGK